jgi:DNA primase
LIDAATLEQQAEINENYTILSLFGTNGFTSEIETAIKELQELEEVVLFFDGDTAGNDSSNKNSRETESNSIRKLTITKVDTPEEEDINSLATRP